MRSNAKELLLKGAFIPAMPLVLNEDRSFDEAGQRRLIRYYLESGVDGIAAAVHTTQFAIHDPKCGLLEKVLSAAVREIRHFEAEKDKTVLAIAGVCGPTEQAVAEAKLAQRLGYDAVLLSPGGLSDRDETYLLDRTGLVANETDVIGFYLQPSVGGRVLSYGYWQALCGIEGVCAIKSAPFDRYLTADVARAIAFSGRRIALYTGNDDNILADLMTQYRFEEEGTVRTVAVVGGLLGHWAVWTHTAVSIFRRLKNDLANGGVSPEWLTLAAQITDANSAFFDTRNRFAGCIAGIHEVLRRQGLMKGNWCLDPQETLSPGQAEEIDRVYRQYPHISDDDFVREFLARVEKF